MHYSMNNNMLKALSLISKVQQCFLQIWPQLLRSLLDVVSVVAMTKSQIPGKSFKSIEVFIGFFYELVKESNMGQSVWCYLLHVAWQSSSASLFLFCKRVAKGPLGRGFLTKFVVSGSWFDFDRFWLDVTYCCSKSWSDIQLSLGDKQKTYIWCQIIYDFSQLSIHVEQTYTWWSIRRSQD